MPKPQPPKRYLGDGVYAGMEGDMVKLTTENGLTIINTIYLEESVMNALYKYWDDVVKASNQPD
jgi:hypothetical protein